MKELNQKLAIIQTKLKAKKSSYNSFGKYYFRKSEDILEAIKPFLIEQGVTVTINEEMISTDPVPTMQSTATISDGKDAIHATALVGVDLAQKGMQTAQQFGAASTYGKKYALGNLLLIDDTEDADSGKKATSTTIDPSNLNAENIQAFQQAQGGLSSALSKLMVVVERYPDLKANQNFLSLQEELTSTENKISFSRQNYNDQVLFYNNKIQMFPSNIVAGMFRFTEEEFFEIEDEREKEVPKVSFS